MGYFLLGAIVLLLGLLLLSMMRDLKARSLRLIGLALLFALAATALLVFVVSGRYGFAAPAGALALWVMWAYLLARQIKSTGRTADAPITKNAPMSRDEALEILGLDASADAQAIEDAYKALIMKNHPDQGGTDWLAARLNEARRILLDT